jgi:phage gp36-like protein
LIEEERKRKLKQLDTLVAQQVSDVDKLQQCLHHYADKLDQTVHFTRRLLDYSSVTEVRACALVVHKVCASGARVQAVARDSHVCHAAIPTR